MVDFLAGMFRFGRYKSTQGKIARQLTALTVTILFVIAAWRFYQLQIFGVQAFRGLIAGLIALLGAWFAYRLVQFPPFADFLVSVEAEMIKVYWPPKNELYSSTIVVLVVFLLLSVLIFVFDSCWHIIFQILNILPGWYGGGGGGSGA